MYMIGQVAALRDAVTTIAELHGEVSHGAVEAARRLGRTPTRAVARPEPPPPAEVAVIGLGCILPGAQDAESFWANILEKVDAIREVPPERWDWRRMFDPDPPRRTRSTRAGEASSTRCALDPLALGLPPKSLQSIEPFQLLALLCAQAALEDAGYGQRPFDRERTSVILGAGGGGADTVGRLHGPLGTTVAARRRPPRAAGAAVRAAPGVDRGQLRRTADERRRRTHRQPARPRRDQLHRRRGLRLLAQRHRPRRPGAAGGNQRHGARGRRRRDPEPVRLPVLRQDPRALADRPLPALRRVRRRDRHQRGVRDRRAQAARRCGARRRPHLRRDPRRRRRQRRARPQPHRAAPGGPDAGPASGLRAGAGVAGHGRARRGPRHRHGRRRRRRGRGAQHGLRRALRASASGARSARSSR